MTRTKWITKYLNWFNDEIKCIETEHGLYVNTPFLTIDNDYITLRINEMDDGRIIISDDSKTMQHLFLWDFELNNERLNTILMILNKLGCVVLSKITQLHNYTIAYIYTIFGVFRHTFIKRKF